MSPPNEDPSVTSQDVVQSVIQCVRDGGWRTYRGPKLDELELWFHQQFQAKHTRLCSSGTLGVELALRSFHLKPGDEVILSAYDYPGNFRCVEDVGALPVLCRPDTTRGWCLSANDLEQCIAPRTKAIIVSHLHGQIAPVQEIVHLARAHGVLVVEDACQAIGGSVEVVDKSISHSQPLGTFGDVGVFSFGGSKLISAGRGGAVITSSDLFAQRMRNYCERGNDAYALSEIQAAIVLPQCRRLWEDHELRGGAARRLIAQLATMPGLEPVSLQPGCSQAFYKIGVRLQPTALPPWNRDEVLGQLTNLGVLAGEGFRSFARRSPKRFRTPHHLHSTEVLADSTIVIHHDHLLHPTTGADTSLQVSEAFCSITEKRLHSSSPLDFNKVST